MKKTLLFLSLMLYATSVYGQSFKFEYQTGFHFSKMEGLSELNDAYLESLTFDAKIVDNFPGYLYYKPSFMVVIYNFDVGLSYLFTSTGSRISAKDFSGDYNFDMKIKTDAPSIFLGKEFNISDLLSIGVRGNVGIDFSKLLITENLTIDNQELMDYENVFKSHCVYLQPQLSLIYNSSHFNIGLNLGYFIQFYGENPFLTDDENNVIFSGDRNDPIKSEWNGLGIGISISYPFRRII